MRPARSLTALPGMHKRYWPRRRGPAHPVSAPSPCTTVGSPRATCGCSEARDGGAKEPCRTCGCSEARDGGAKEPSLMRRPEHPLRVGLVALAALIVVNVAIWGARA